MNKEGERPHATLHYETNIVAYELNYYLITCDWGNGNCEEVICVQYANDYWHALDLAIEYYAKRQRITEKWVVAE